MSLEERRETFLKQLKEVKGNQFELLEGFTKTREKALFRHNICGYEWYTTPYNLIKSKSTGCPNCQYREKSKTTEEVKKEIYSKYKDEYSIIEGQEYKNNRTKLLFRHNYCGNEFLMTSSSLLKNKIPCPVCCKKNRNTGRKTTEEFKKELYDKHKGEYVLSSGSEYKSSLEKVKIIHTTCGHEWDVRASHILHTSKCPNCNESKGENLVKNILDNLNVYYTREYIFEDLKNVKNLPFDFAILKDGNVIGLIEYDGSQHFIPYKHFGGLEKLNKTQYNDNKKNKYCEYNNIPLKRIKYDLSKEEVENEVELFINSIIESKTENC